MEDLSMLLTNTHISSKCMLWATPSYYSLRIPLMGRTRTQKSTVTFLLAYAHFSRSSSHTCDNPLEKGHLFINIVVMGSSILNIEENAESPQEQR